jgi:thiamine transport system permease protein
MSVRFQKRLGRIFLWLVPILFIILFFYYPLTALFRTAIERASQAAYTTSPVQEIGSPLLFTILQAFASTALTLLIGLPMAYLFTRYTFTGKSLLQMLATLPFILPTVVVAAGFNALLGPNGWLNLILKAIFHLQVAPIRVLNSLSAIVLAHVFYNTAIVLRVVGSKWAQLDARYEQAGRVLGASPWRNFREITLPLLSPAILAATLLVFLFDFTSFGVILLLGGPAFSTLETEIYKQVTQNLNVTLAAVLSAIQLIFTFGLMLAISVTTGKLNIPLLPQLTNTRARKAANWKQKIFVILSIFVILALFISPLASLIARSFTRFEADQGERGAFRKGFTTRYYLELFINVRNSRFYIPPVSAILNSLSFAGITVVVALLLSFLTLYASRSRSGLSRVIEPFLMLPLGASAVTLGLGMILVFNRPPFEAGTSSFLIPIAHSLIAYPFVLRILQPAYAAIPISYRQAAATLGATPWQVWKEVDVPLLVKPALVGALFAFTISLGEFGATSFLVNPTRPTLPVAISQFLQQPGALNYGQAMAMATILMLICGSCILLIEKLEKFI